MKRWPLPLILPILMTAGPAIADPADDLARAYYDYTVAEYCGLITPPVKMGHSLLRHDLMARGNLRPETDWAMRLKGSEEAEYQYQNWGLSGNKRWCRTDGASAVARFTSYFQRRELP